MAGVQTILDVVEALGGRRATAEIVSVTPAAVTNWLRAQRFPARTYVTLQTALETRGFNRAPDSLWPMAGVK